MTKEDKEFLSWVADRLVYVHKENPNFDFVLKLRKMAKDEPKREFVVNPNSCSNEINCSVIGIATGKSYAVNPEKAE